MPLRVFAISGVIAFLAFAVPANSQPEPIWGGHFNNGVFAAGGGSERDGHISLSCAGDGLDDAGRFFLQLEPAAEIEPFINAPPQLDFVIDGEVITLPVTAENGAVFFYQADADDDALARELITALRRGFNLTVSAPELDIADISLRGSFEALIYVENCVTGMTRRSRK